MMKIRKKFIFLIGLFISVAICSAQAPRQIKVIVDYANIRVNPALDAEILDVAAKGKLYDVAEKSGAWYTIVFSVDQSGRTTYGYIHESNVTPVGEPWSKPVPAEQPKEPVPPPPPPVPLGEEKPPAPPLESTRAQTKVRSYDKVISGSFLKFGFGDRWLASFGYDHGLGRNFGLGLELQPYYESHSEIDLSIIQLDVFLNAKLGFQLAFLKLYGGGGIGPDLTVASTEIEGESLSSFETKLAYHLIVGTELDLKSIGILFEFQMLQVSDPDVDPDEWAYFFLVGLRF